MKILTRSMWSARIDEEVARSVEVSSNHYTQEEESQSPSPMPESTILFTHTSCLLVLEGHQHLTCARLLAHEAVCAVNTATIPHNVQLVNISLNN